MLIKDNIKPQSFVTAEYNVFAVYLINCALNVNWHLWIKDNIALLGDLKCRLYIIAIVNPGTEDDVKKVVNESVSSHIIETNIEFYHENEFEYRGILKVWDLAQKNPGHNDVILYYHSKNITRATSPANNDKNFNRVVTEHANILNVFKLLNFVNKVGMYCSQSGFLWGNYFWARGSYISCVEKPIKTQRRHYYEDWISRRLKDPSVTQLSEIENRDYSKYIIDYQDCYNMNFYNKKIHNVGSYYHPHGDQYVD